MKLYKIEDLHEDRGEVLVMRITSLDEPPEMRNAHINDIGFDCEYWTHFVELPFNSILEQAASM